MPEESILPAIELLVGLLGLSALVAVLARAIRLPDTVALSTARASSTTGPGWCCSRSR